MDFLTDWLTNWLKELLISGIMGNLEGLFDTVNAKVGEIAVQVGTTPAAWNAGVFSLIRQLSETVILPIAGLVLTFVATYELIQMLLEKNNMHEFDVANIRNMGAYMRKMALNGYVLHVDLSPVRELVSLQRRCSNNLNQVAIQANTYGGIYPEEIAALQQDYAALWGPLSDLLKKLSALVEL